MAMRLDNFRLYVSKSNGIFIPIHDYNVLLLVEGAEQGASFASKMPLTRKMLFAYTPRIQRVFNRVMKADLNGLRKNYGKKVTLLFNTQTLQGKSFYFDITTYIHSLRERFSSVRFAKEGLNFFKNIVASVKDANKETILLYYIDESILPKQIREREMYSFMFTYALRRHLTDLGISKIFLVGKKSVRLIYDQEMEANNKFSIFLKWIVNATKTKRIITIEDDKDNLDNEETKDLIDLIQDEKDTKQIKDKDKTKEPIQTIDKTQKDKVVKKQTQIITSRDLDRATSDIIKNVAGDISRLNISIDTALSRLNSFAKSNDNVSKAVMNAYVSDDLYSQKQIVQASMTQTTDPEAALLSPNANDVQNIHQQENTAKHLGLTQVLPVDALHKPDVTKKLVKNNVAHALARRHGYQESVSKTLKKSLMDPLAEIGYQLLDVTFTKISDPDTELYRTELEWVNVKCKNQNGQTETLKFKVPKLTEDRYVLSGGLKWYYPTVLSTLPIFIVKPTKVQFRSNYSAISFDYGIFNRREDIRCYIGGFKIPMTLLLSVISSVEGVLKTFNFNYIISTKKQNNLEYLNLPLADGTFLVIQRKSDTLSKVILSGFEQMFSKYKPKDIQSTKEAYISLKTYTKQNKSEYVLKRTIQYIVDVQTNDVLKAHNLPTELPKIIKHCAELAISGESDDKLSIDNTYLRTIDIIVAGVEKGIQSGVSIYKKQRIYTPDAPLKVNSGHVINFFREYGVLQMLEQQNPVEEVAGYSSVKIVGPGGLPNKDAVQPKDRAMRRSHFGNLDPADTSEGDPGIRLFLTTGHVYDSEKHSFMPMSMTNNNTDVLGLTASLTPFVDRDDQARLNMACNQARQAVPIVSSEEPIVLTGAEASIPTLTSSTFTKRAKKDGTVIHIDDNVIILQYTDGSKEAFDIRPVQLKSGSGLDSAITYSPSVRVGDNVKRNRMLTTNQFMKPILAQGINLKCAYMSYLGYNYEDGVVMSESTAKKLTSLHYEIVEIELTEKDRLALFPAIGQHINKGDTVCIVKRNVIGETALTEDYEIIAPSELKVVDIEIYPKHISLVSDILAQLDNAYKETNNILKAQGLSPIFDKQKIVNNVGKYTAHGEKLPNTLIKIKLLRYMPISLGDKVTNRHGAKGVTGHIVPDHLMPTTESGERMEILINVLSVVSRMNLGQMYEVQLGKILHFAMKRIAEMLHTNKTRVDIEEFIIKLYDILDGTKDKTYSSEIAKNIQSMSDSDFKRFILGVINGNLRFMVPPFQSPTTKSLELATRFVGTTLADQMLLPEINSKTQNPVVWGIMYIQKLEHISSVKQNVRNVGPYIKTTLEPTRGKARAGGQRMGEMDSHCLLAYDALNVLSDFWVVNADNPEAKKQVMSEIYKTGKADVNFDLNRSGAGQLFDSVLICMGVEPRT